VNISKPIQPLQSAGIIVYRLICNQPEYLVLHYQPGGHWDFAKGKIENEESRKDAAIRELAEETNLCATLDPCFERSISYTGHYGKTEFLKTVYYFIGCVPEHVTITLSSEHQAFDWLLYADAYERLTYTNAKNLLTQAHIYINTILLSNQ
jgi:bis(5'-nucleosidyl)-tetraphosphatase